ncbi:MAG: hypothetical protein AVDCRST_MAG07-1755 [uncultured Frankineae bacterium]|uniref:PpiC domain-containing protein n=1 Tax=uncultured Frankineae bacterium TaxID=437475 RepID=A0A6J4LEY4_9ACTN|nr:MAG: hypothetical protein AVDCRST_MAG07-1755 [uncultured Frankineae bacterium]
MLSARVVEEAARREGVTVTSGQVDQQYAALEESVGGPEQLQQQAAAAGLTPALVRDLARTRALTSALADRLSQGTDVPEEELRAAYEANIDQFDQVRTAQVQLATLADAQALLPQARGLSDEAFQDLARERSVDESTKEQGGDLGLQPRSAFDQQGLEAFGAAAFGARVGDTFAVESPRGGHVVRVIERDTTTFEQARDDLRRQALESQSGPALQELLARTAADLDITINPRFGAWDAASLAVVERTDAGDRQISSPEAPATGPQEPADGGLLPEGEPEVPTDPEEPPVEPETPSETSGR